MKKYAIFQLDKACDLCYHEIKSVKFQSIMKQVFINTRSFTLIELMIVVSIADILASVAYPSYVESVQRGNRAEARGILLEMAQLLERNFTEANRYDQDSAGNAFVLPVVQSPRTGTAKYVIQFSAGPTQTTYTLGAVPAGAMTGDASAILIMAISNSLCVLLFVSTGM